MVGKVAGSLLNSLKNSSEVTSISEDSDDSNNRMGPLPDSEERTSEKLKMHGI